MRVCDIKGEQYASEDSEIEQVLTKRYHGFNEFWLDHGSEDNSYPSLVILVNDQLAYLYYLLNEEHPGFHSVGAVSGLDNRGTTKFLFRGAQDEFSNDSVVPFATALEAAKEFSKSKSLPHCVKWFELGKGIE